MHLQEKFKKGTYLPRRLYGLYLESLHDIVLDKAKQHGVNVNFIREKVKNGKVIEESGKAHFKASLESGRAIYYDIIFDATGNGPILASIPGADKLSPEQYVKDPWVDLPDSVKQSDGTIVVLGMGLTFVDKIKELIEAGFPDIHRHSQGIAGVMITGISEDGRSIFPIGTTGD